MKVVVLVLALIAYPGLIDGQTPAPSKAAIIKPEELANEWFIRLNQLDDWYISYDGKEENQNVVNRFLELYAEDAFHQVGPSATQIGPVIFHGKEAIRKWADDFSRKSTQFEAIFTNREDRRQFVVPGAVFFMFDEAGKIDSVRLYLLQNEAAEIA
jgi:hypothetical protein